MPRLSATALSLLAAVAVIAWLVASFGSTSCTATPVPVSSSVSTFPGAVQPMPRLVALEAKVVEASSEALAQVGVSLNTIRPGESARLDEQAALQLLDQPDARPGVRLIADLVYTIPTNRPARFASGVETPTQTTSTSASGMSIQGFGGYEKSDVTATFTAQPGREESILLSVDFQVRNRIGRGPDGIPPTRTTRSGSFAAVSSSGELRVLGGMIRSDEDASYLLFFMKPSWIE